MTPADREALAKAVKSLEHPSLAARLTNLVGKPVELIGYALPSFASKAIASATSKGLEAALKVALRTLPRPPRTGSEFFHRALATASGAAGGTFGIAALPVELPVSTVIMLRSIADIAQNEGEDLSDPESVPSCVEGTGRTRRIRRRIRERIFRGSRPAIPAGPRTPVTAGREPYGKPQRALRRVLIR